MEPLDKLGIETISTESCWFVWWLIFVCASREPVNTSWCCSLSTSWSSPWTILSKTSFTRFALHVLLKKTCNEMSNSGQITEQSLEEGESDDFIFGSLTSQGILPLSGLSLQAVSLDPNTSHPPHMFEISGEWTSSAKNATQRKALNVKYVYPFFHLGPMLESKVFICSSAADLQRWMQQIEDRKYKSMTQPMSPSHCALSYLVWLI